MLVKLLLVALTLIGVWLAGYSDTSLLQGLLVAFVAASALIVLARRENALPLEAEQREGWEVVRAKGRRSYILRSVASGLFVGSLFLLYQLIRASLSGKPFTANSGFVLVALFIILYIGGSYYAAIRRWALYEERYKESFPLEARHNDSLNRSAD